MNVIEVGAAAVSLEMGLEVHPVSDFLSVADDVRQEVISELRRSADLEVLDVDVSIYGVRFDE